MFLLFRPGRDVKLVDQMPDGTYVFEVETGPFLAFSGWFQTCRRYESGSPSDTRATREIVIGSKGCVSLR